MLERVLFAARVKQETHHGWLLKNAPNLKKIVIGHVSSTLILRPEVLARVELEPASDFTLYSEDRDEVQLLNFLPNKNSGVKVLHVQTSPFFDFFQQEEQNEEQIGLEFEQQNFLRQFQTGLEQMLRNELENLESLKLWDPYPPGSLNVPTLSILTNFSLKTT